MRKHFPSHGLVTPVFLSSADLMPQSLGLGASDSEGDSRVMNELRLQIMAWAHLGLSFNICYSASCFVLDFKSDIYLCITKRAIF